MNDIQLTACIMSELTRQSLPVVIKPLKELTVTKENIYHALTGTQGLNITIDDVDRILTLLHQMHLVGWSQSLDGKILGYKFC